MPRIAREIPSALKQAQMSERGKKTIHLAQASPNVGRPKNSKTFFGVELKEMTMEALYELGGLSYLVKIGKEHPRDFLSFISRFIPTKQEITGADGEGQTLKICFTEDTSAEEREKVITEAAQSYINNLEQGTIIKEIE